MSKSIRVFVSETFDPWFNLATEEWIFREMDPNTFTLFLWRNQNTVVIGRSQNPWAECNTEKMEADGIHLARRTTGGGAVFQDLGNTNFTFLTNPKDFDKQHNAAIILDALNKLGINAEASGRNDLIVKNDLGEPRKISGSAFRLTQDRAFHHGTLLIDTDLKALEKYLQPNPKKLAAKGVQSVRSRVVNLRELNPSLNHENLSEAIIESFYTLAGAHCKIEILNADALKQIPSLMQTYETFKDWHWRFGKTLKFEHTFENHFSWGLVNVHLNYENGHIKELQIFSDSLFPEMITALNESLINQPYSPQGIQKSLEKLDHLKDHQAHIAEFATWFSQEIT